MIASRHSPIPEVYILWHPSCSLGEPLARQIHNWLRPGNGLGPNVFYRSLPAPEAPPGGLPPPLPGESRPAYGASSGGTRVSNVQIVLPMIDANLIADPTWRQWLDRLARERPAMRRIFRPIALDPTAYNVQGPLRDLNFLRPAGLPLGVDDKIEPVPEGIVRSLLKQLTEALCHFMLAGEPDDTTDDLSLRSQDAALPKLKIFLSHAKADGTNPARRLRDYIYSQTQLAAFYDENDIAYGSAFARVLQSDLTARETAAFIAVRSARYATRPWCRRELSLFRRPRRDTTVGAPINRWRLNPTLVVDALEAGRQTASIPEFGNSPSIRWADTVTDQEEQVVTTLLRDVMLSAFHAAMGAAIQADANQIVINWIPDPTTLLQIEGLHVGGEKGVIHPGRGLSGLELDILSEFFPHLTFHSFEETIA
jgi:hypothetical protein